MASHKRTTRHTRQPNRRPNLQQPRLRLQHNHRRPHTRSSTRDNTILEKFRPYGKNHSVLRRRRTCRQDAGRFGKRKLRHVQEKPRLCGAYHRKRHLRTDKTGLFQVGGREIPRNSHYKQTALNRCGLQDGETDSTRPEHQLHDGVQTNCRPWHPHTRERRQDAFHHYGFPQHHPPLCRPRLGRPH